eukprot:2332819-Rhodomonas_salina.2
MPSFKFLNSPGLTWRLRKQTNIQRQALLPPGRPQASFRGCDAQSWMRDGFVHVGAVLSASNMPPIM